MTRDELVKALSSLMPVTLATDLVEEFLSLRQDALVGTLERAVAGKFVETVVQILQHVESGMYERKPAVDVYLVGLDKASPLPDSLRFSTARTARAMYTLRNKRNIAHKGDIDPNVYDLAFLHHSAQWVMAELLRSSAEKAGAILTMESAGKLISLVQAPVGVLVEDHDGRKLVLPDLSACDELLVLLRDAYPRSLSLAQLKDYMRRRDETTVTKCSRTLWTKKVIDGDSKGYRLTGRGLQEFAKLMSQAASNR